jgi:hypothetical protein
MKTSAGRRKPHLKRALLIGGIFIAAALTVWSVPQTAQASPLASGSMYQFKTEGIGPIVNVRAVVRRGGMAVGRRGAVAYRSRTVVRPGWHGAGTRWARPVAPRVRPGWAGGGVRWVRPANYWWRPGAAVAAGAAIGFVSAATAVAWAGAAPAPGYCWYYTDPSRRQGFWDACPR